MMRRRLRAPALVLILAATAACATSLPDVRPFAAGTADLYRTNGVETRAILSEYDASIDLADDLLGGRGPRLSAGEDSIVASVRKRLEADRKSFRSSARAFDRVLEQAVSYSERLSELAAAGRSGRNAAASLASTLDGFASLAGAPGLVGGAAARLLGSVSDYVTRVQARGSLREAAAEAQGAVDSVARALEEIYGGENAGAVERLVTSLASDHDQLLLYRAGAGIVGYYREASGRRQQFYRRAQLTLQLNDTGIAGFCRDPDSGELDPDCISVRELAALRDVEETLKILAPEVRSYEAERSELRAWRAARRTHGRLIVKAVRAWAAEHRKVVKALEEGSDASAFSLKAILDEIQAIR